jgi:hypothetical protein
VIVRIIVATAGAILVLGSLNDVFQSVIVPRAVGRRFRPSVYQTRGLWHIWPKLGRRFYRDEDKREDFLAIFAPTNLIVSLMMWSLMMLAGYGLLFFAMREQTHPAILTFGDAFYFAGTSFFTIGFGDYYGTTGWTRALSLAAGASGFGVISSTTAYLFAIFGAFQAREQVVVTIGARAGSPPSGVGLLAIAGYSQTVDDLPAVMREGQRWCATILETHLAYPVLNFFRSSHDYESWVGTLGTLLDAALLMMTTVECKSGEARIMYTIGRHAAHDLAKYLNLSNGEAETEPHVSQEQYDQARTRLQQSGLTLMDRDDGWQQFSRLRGGYAGHLDALAAFFDIPRLQWLGQNQLFTSDHARSQLDPNMLERIDKA